MGGGVKPEGRPDVVVRRATLGDIEQMATNMQLVADEGRYLWVEKVTEETKGMLKRMIEDKGCLALVAEAGRGRQRKLVGSLTLGRYGQTVKKSQHVRVLAMLVIGGYRDMGIGSKLMEESVRWSKRQPGVEKVILGVFSNNGRALGLYEKFGFKVEGVRKDHYYIDGKHEDEIDMALFVKGPRA